MVESNLNDLITATPINKRQDPYIFPIIILKPLSSQVPKVYHASNIQGNILKGFNKDHVRYIFFNIDDVDKARDWFRELVEAERIPSTQNLIDAAANMKKMWDHQPDFKPRETWIHVAFSVEGIKKFGLELPPSHNAYEFGDPNFGGDPEKIFLKDPDVVIDDTDPFNKGMAGRNTQLGDTGDDAPTKWIEPFNHKLNLIDGLLRIDSDEAEDADQTTVDLLVESTERGITSLGLQKGTAVLNSHGKGTEHFGFRDGVSQPLFEGIDEDTFKNRKIEKDTHDPKKFVIFGLTGNREWANDGSFMVFRRLSQDFSAFWKFMEDKSPDLGLSPVALAAKFVGRWRSGAPLAKFPNGDPNLPDEFDDNDFVYLENKEEDSGTAHPELDDPRGEHTPRFAHIRKVYPRDDGLSDDPEQNDISSDHHRVLRRGIPYGPIFANDPDAERGLLFACYQIDLEQQFEFIQTKWANNPNFPRKDDQPPDKTTNPSPTPLPHGPDLIIGKHHGTGFVSLAHQDPPGQEGPTPQHNLKFTKIDGQTEAEQTNPTNPIGFKQWVATTGGGYFFSPSISALKKLKP